MLFDDDFLLETDVARELYHRYAAGLPIIDYHCHLPPEHVATDHRFRSLTAIWLDGDHYKWRAMRSNGVPEDFCTGAKDDWEKFEAWAATVPKTLRNPLYHWTHLELKFPFGIRKLLNPISAREIYDRGNALLQGPSFTARGLLRQFNVQVVCTTDDPADSLEHHAAYARDASAGATRMYPTFRPDRALDVDQPQKLNGWVERLEARVGSSVNSYDQLLAALDSRHRAFHELGGRLSDHGLETAYSDDYNLAEVRETFAAARAGRAADPGQTARFRSALLHELALLDHARGWVQQFHLGALRNNNTRMQRSLGPDTGFDSIGDFEIARPLAKFLDRLDQDNRLAKTILYNLNPRDNEVLATMIGNFQDGSVPGKLQFGSAWWFLDQLDGMEKQIHALSQMGLLSRFVGMLTDSRSFLSYSRHEYFRRLLCNILGHDVRRGLLPDDRELLGEMVTDICFRNARGYFGLG
ncbi:MAG TPA: glucuronate isomerase [Polyangiaceae bacterium]|nr:glucuronate isomerase [Polyangiaceae bacterium]